MDTRQIRVTLGGLIALSMGSVSCAGDHPESHRDLTLQSGKTTPVEVTIPAADPKSDAQTVRLDLNHVVLPKNVSGLRIFLESDGLQTDRAPIYVTSIAKGQQQPSNPPESFSVELTPSLAQLDSKSGSRDGAPRMVKLLLEPISIGKEVSSDSVMVGSVALRRE